MAGSQHLRGLQRLKVLLEFFSHFFWLSGHNFQKYPTSRVVAGLKVCPVRHK